VINGTCDIGNMSRPMKASEIQAARDKGVNVMQHIVAMDGIAVAVHPANPVDNLTLEQVRKVYMGEITNWSELGGPNRKIVVISRDTNSGTYETFSELVMDTNKVTDKAEYVGSNGAIRQRILSTEGAIGYVGLAFLQGVKPLVIGGVEPTPENVIDGSYPISRPLFMYTNGEPAEDTHLGAFLSLYKTEEGRQIVEEQGFVPVP
jgi:phosphate transport system substrate-binding protein